MTTHAVSRAARTGRDLCLILIGLIALRTTPYSVAAGLHQSDLTGTLLTTVWALTLVAGGTACLIGWVTHRPLLEVTGCLLAAAGFLTWSVAALTQPQVGPTAWIVSLLLIAGVCGQVYRAAEVIEHARPVRWE